MDAFGNTGGNCFGIIPPMELHAFVQRVRDPVKEGKNFGQILFVKADCKGTGGQKYYMAVDYLDVMLNWKSGADEPNWEPFFRSALENFCDDSEHSHCPIKRIQAMLAAHVDKSRPKPLSLSSYSKRSSSDTRSDSASTDEIAQIKAANILLFSQQVVTGFKRMVRTDKQVL